MKTILFNVTAALVILADNLSQSNMIPPDIATLVIAASNVLARLIRSTK